MKSKKTSTRNCVGYGGKPKRSFSTFDEANTFLTVQNQAVYYRPYACDEHGWHIGGKLSRALRGQLLRERRT
jgi:hypothetical protein